MAFILSGRENKSINMAKEKTSGIWGWVQILILSNHVSHLQMFIEVMAAEVVYIKQKS